MRWCIVALFLAACGPSQFAQQHERKVQAARAGCQTGAQQHEALMGQTPPTTVNWAVAKRYNQQQEDRIKAALDACAPAMRLGQDDAWLHAELRYGEGHEKLLQDLTAMMPKVEKDAHPDMLRLMVDAVHQARSHYGYAIESRTAPQILDPVRLSSVKTRIAKLDAAYTKLKAVQAKQYE